MAVAEKNGNWYIVQSIPTTLPDGRKKYPQKWIPISATDRESADKMEQEYLDNKKKGLDIDPNRTVLDLFKLWIEQRSGGAKPLKKGTIIWYSSMFYEFINPEIGNQKAVEVTITELDDVISACAKKGNKDTTLRGVYATMSAMFGWAKRKKKLKENPMEFVDEPAVAEREYTLLEKEDIPKLLKGVLQESKFDNQYRSNQRKMYHNMFLLELTTAIRIDELCAIRDIDIDFKKKVLHVRQQVEKAGSNPEFGPPKNKKSRDIPLGDIVVEQLKKEIEYRNFKRESAKEDGKPWYEHGLIFTLANGNPVHAKNLNTRTLKKALKKAELPKMKFHELRHSVLTLLADANEDPNAICDMAGHSDYNFMKKKYIHTNRKVQAQRSASKKLEEMVFEQEEPAKSEENKI
jgi:integrase